METSIVGQISYRFTMNFEVIEILDSVLNSKGRKLKKPNEYMYWSPFVSHHKPKLQVNIETGK